MLVEVEGRMLEFPDGTSEDVISEAIKREFAPPPISDVLSHGVRSGVSSLQRTAAGAVEFAGDITGSEGLAKAGKGIKESADISEELAQPTRPPTWAQGILGGAVSSAISASPYIAAGTVGGGEALLSQLGKGATFDAAKAAAIGVASRMGLVPMATGAGAERYGELRGEGFSIPRSLFHATVEGGAEYLGERSPLSYLGKALGKESAAKLLSGWFGRELGGEEVTSIIEYFNAKFSDRPDATLKDFAQTLVDTAATTAVLGPIQGAVIAPIQYASNVRVRRAMERQVIDEMKKNAPDLKEGTVTPAESPPITPETDEDITKDLLPPVTPEEKAAVEAEANAPATPPELQSPGRRRFLQNLGALAASTVVPTGEQIQEGPKGVAVNEDLWEFDPGALPGEPAYVARSGAFALSPIEQKDGSVVWEALQEATTGLEPRLGIYKTKQAAMAAIQQQFGAAALAEESLPEVARMQEEGVEPASLEDKLRAALAKGKEPTPPAFEKQLTEIEHKPIYSAGERAITQARREETRQGTVEILNELRAIPEDQRTPEQQARIRQEEEYLADIDRAEAEDAQLFAELNPRLAAQEGPRIGPETTTLAQPTSLPAVDLLTQSASDAIDTATAEQDNRPDTALSRKAVGNLIDNYPENANNAIPLGKLPVSWSNGYEGPIRLPNMKPGDVIVAGTSNEMFPPALVEAYGKLYDYLNRKFMGGKGKLIIVLRSPKTKGIVNTSWHTKQGDVHIIQPPHGLALGLRAGEGQPSTEYNVFRKAQIALGAYHEFAHALVYDAIYSFIPQRVMQYLEKESNNWEPIPPHYLEAIPNPLIRAMVKEYSDAKVALNTASGLDFFQNWMSPAKLNNAWLSKYGLGAKTYPEAISYLESRTAKEVVAVMETKSRGRMQVLSFPEYVGEQMARWAYGGTSKLAQAQRTSGLGGTVFGRHFASVWNSMKKLLQEVFVAAKRDQVIKPGTEFQAWLESLTKAPAITDKEIVGTGKGLDKVEEDITQHAVERKAEKTAKERKAKEEKDSELHGFTDKDLRTALRGAGIKPDEPEYKEIVKLFNDGDVVGAVTMFKEVTGKPFRYDSPEARDELSRITTELGVGEVGEAGLTEAQAKNPKVRERANHLFHFMKTRSPFFTNWFGKSGIVDIFGEPMEVLTDIGAVFVPKLGQFMSLAKLQRMAKDAGVPMPAYMPFAVTRSSDLAAMEQFIDRDLTPRMEEVARTKRERVAHLRELRFGLEDQRDQVYALRAEQLNTVLEGEVEGALSTSISEMNAWAARYIAMTRQLDGRITSMKAEEDQLVKEIQAILDNPINYDDSRKPVAVYAKVENPLRIAGGVRGLTSEQLSDFMYQALAEGRDGLLVSDFPTGIGTRTTLVVPLHTVQLKWVKSLTFSSAPTIHWDWDQTEVHEMNAKDVVEKARAAAPHTKLRRFFIRYVDLLHATLQAQQIAQMNPDVVGAQKIIETGRLYSRDIAAQLSLAQEAAELTSALGKEMKKRLWDAQLAEVKEQSLWLGRTPVANATPVASMLEHVLVGSEALRQAVTEQYQITDRTLEKMREHGIDFATPEGKKAIEAYLKMKNSHFAQMQLLEWALKQRIFERISDHGEQVRQWKLISAKFEPLKNTPFLPQMWFGNHVLVVKAKIEGKWQIVHKEAWEDVKDFLDRAEVLEKNKKANERVERVEVDDQQYVLMALPTEFLAEVARELGLTAEQLVKLEELAQPLKIDKAVARYTTEHLQVSGASEDMDRVFAAFSWHQANYIAKLRYRPLFRHHIASIRAQSRLMERSSLMDPAEKYVHVERYASIAKEMNKAVDYLMSPEQEMANFRAAIATLYLAFNVKTALINLYGLITTYSAVTSELGTVKGSALFVRGLGYAARAGIASWTMKSPEQKRLATALDRGIKEGVLSQSYAYMLAGQAIGGFWQRQFNRLFGKLDDITKLNVGYAMGRAGKSITDFGMAPFRMFELATRRATFIIKYMQGMQTLPPPTGGDLAIEDNAYQYAVRATEELQSDWGRLNRPRMFRGSGKGLGALVPAGTIFMSFAQHMAFHAYGGYQAGQAKLARVEGKSLRSTYAGYTMRIWLITLMVAGLKGLPGAENLFDILNWLWRHFTGKTFEQGVVRKYTQEVAKMNIPVLSFVAQDPMTVMYGAAHNVWGFDLSRSVGFGRMVPGTDVLTRPTDNPAALIGGAVSSFMGPAGSTAYWAARYMLDPTYTNMAKLPGGVGSFLQAVDWYKHGARGPQGNRLVTDENGAIRDLTAKEISGRALGFRPTVVSQAQEMAFEAWDTKLYWQTRRNDVLELGRTAYLLQDREGIADFKKALAEYNADTPPEYPELKITGKDVSNTVIQRIKRARALEKGVELDKKYYRLERDVMSSYKKVPDDAGLGEE